MQTETIQESAKLKQNFQFTLSRLGHEIRNPIALISSELQLMASSHPEVCRFEQWDDLMDNLDYIKELLNELSDFSHSGTVQSSPVKNIHWIIWVSLWKLIWSPSPPLY